MTVFVPNTGNDADINAQLSTSRLEFGISDAHNEHVVPVVAFKFYKPDGSVLDEEPMVYIRMTSSFETSVRSPYSETEGIFGQPKGDVEGITGALGALGRSGVEALQRQILNAAGAGVGFIASAGASGKAQVEFLRREVFNTFNQLLYRGPQFRPFQLSFSMRPTSYNEAVTMRQIIRVFKLASEARAGLKNTYAAGLAAAITKDGQNLLDASATQNTEGGGKEFVIHSEPNGITRSDLSNLFGDDVSNFTFGYPNLCSFEIMLYNKGQELSTVFQSKICVIEGLSMTYGSQNKLTFFKRGTSGEYFPTDVNFQISLKEAVYHTHSDSVNESNRANLTIL